MATLGEIRAAVLPAATLSRPLTPAESEREVAWVRVLVPRDPPSDALDAGDLAIVPGSVAAASAADPAATEALAATLARARVAAVVLCGDQAGAASDGPTAAAVDGLAAATERAGLTTFRLVPADPLGLERRLIAYLVNQRAEVDRRATELDGQLARLALGGGGLTTLAAAIGEYFGRAVAIENPGGETLAVHAPAEPPSAAAAAARYLSRALGSIAALRIVIPAIPGERGSGGRLLLLGDEPATELERVAGERVAGILGLELARAAALDQARDELRRGEPLPADGPPWVVMMARQVPKDPASGLEDAADRERVRAGLRAIAPARRLLLRGSAESLELRLVVAAPDDDPAGDALAGQIAAYLGRTVAVSRPFPDAGGRPAAEGAARATLDAAEALGEPPPVAHAARLPAYVLLGNLHNIPFAAGQASALLAPLLESGPATRRHRLETLRAILGASGPGEAASSLGVHRNTIAYRTAAIERDTGWNLADPDLRLALQIALRILRRGT
jgi:hypothetical protein